MRWFILLSLAVVLVVSVVGVRELRRTTGDATVQVEGSGGAPRHVRGEAAHHTLPAAATPGASPSGVKPLVAWSHDLAASMQRAQAADRLLLIYVTPTADT